MEYYKKSAETPNSNKRFFNSASLNTSISINQDQYQNDDEWSVLLNDLKEVFDDESKRSNEHNKTHFIVRVRAKIKENVLPSPDLFHKSDIIIVLFDLLENNQNTQGKYRVLQVIRELILGMKDYFTNDQIVSIAEKYFAMITCIEINSDKEKQTLFYNLIINLQACISISNEVASMIFDKEKYLILESFYMKCDSILEFREFEESNDLLANILGSIFHALFIAFKYPEIMNDEEKIKLTFPFWESGLKYRNIAILNIFIDDLVLLLKRKSYIVDLLCENHIIDLLFYHISIPKVMDILGSLLLTHLAEYLSPRIDIQAICSMMNEHITYQFEIEDQIICESAMALIGNKILYDEFLPFDDSIDQIFDIADVIYQKGRSETKEMASFCLFVILKFDKINSIDSRIKQDLLTELFVTLEANNNVFLTQYSLETLNKLIFNAIAEKTDISDSNFVHSMMNSLDIIISHPDNDISAQAQLLYEKTKEYLEQQIS